MTAKEALKMHAGQYGQPLKGVLLEAVADLEEQATEIASLKKDIELKDINLGLAVEYQKQLISDHKKERDELKQYKHEAELYRWLRMFLTTKDLPIILERRPETDAVGDEVDAYLEAAIKEST